MALPLPGHLTHAPRTPSLVAATAFTDTDAMLVTALKEPEQSWHAAALLYDRYAPNVRGMVYRLLGPDPERDDVVQDVFVAAITSIRRLRDPGMLKSWLLGIAVGKVRDNLRARWRRRWLSFLPNEDLPELPAQSEGHADVALEVGRILDKLPAAERIALLLHRLEGLSLEEAARTCAMSVSTFKRRLARGEEKFMRRAGHQPVIAAWLGPKRR